MNSIKVNNIIQVGAYLSMPVEWNASGKQRWRAALRI